MTAGTELSADQLFDLLRAEPATWLGVNQQNGQWTWDLTARTADSVRGGPDRRRVPGAAGCSRRASAATRPRRMSSSMAVPEAFDHLGLAWRTSQVGTSSMSLEQLYQLS